MKLQQGQVWKRKREGDFLRITKWERLAIEYKQSASVMASRISRGRLTARC